MVERGKAHFLELSFPATVELVPAIRRCVGTFCDKVLRDPELASRGSLAAHELLENAVKYGVEEDDVHFRMELGDPRGEMVIRVENRASVDDVALVAQALKSLDQALDPFAYYQGLLRSRLTERGRSGLGLARVRVEAQMLVSHEVNGDRLRVIARSLGRQL